MSQDFIKRVFRCGKLNRMSRIVTGVIISLFVIVVILFTIFGNAGGYLTAWIITITLSIIALVVFSIPRRINVGFGAVDIVCLVELTHIPIADITEIRTVSAEDMKKLWPLLGSFGFFGFFGFYIDPFVWSVYRVYCRNLENCIMISTTYERRFIVSCEEPKQLIELIEDTRHNLRKP